MSGSGSLRVLVVDDERLSREVTLELLSREPRLEVVGTAANGLEAVDVALGLRPDVIVMDLYMPVLDGVDATERIVAEQPDACVLLYTSSDQPGDRERALAAGAVDCLRKEEGFDRLADMIVEVAARCLQPVE